MIEHFRSVKPTPFTLEDLQDLGIDESKQTTGCGGRGNPTGDLWNAGFRYPLNGEFEWGDWGDGCWTCTNNWGEECFDAGAGGRWGVRLKVKRKAFLGDATKCCLANTRSKNHSKVVDGKTCAPKYRDPTTSDCNTILKNYCSNTGRIVNDNICKNLVNTHATLYNQLMTEYCNQNRNNAKSDDCINWCTANRTQCTLLNTIQDCQKYEIPESSCTPQATIDVRTNCLKYGMLSEQGLPIGDYTCSQSGIDKLKEDCQEYKITETCTATGIRNAKVSEQSKQQSEEALKQSELQFEQTQEALRQVLELPENTIVQPSPSPPPSPPAKQQDDLMIIGIIIAFIILLCSSSISSIIYIFINNTEETP